VPFHEHSRLNDFQAIATVPPAARASCVNVDENNSNVS
jgi:hypothetical protein